VDPKAPTTADLERWLEFGAGLRIIEHTEGRTVYEMCTCTGETVERHESEDPAVIAYVSSHAGAGAAGG